MKKVLLILCLAFAGLTAVAQEQGDKAVGAQIVLGSELSNIGLGVKGQYNFTKSLRAEASFNYFLKKDYVSTWDVNANLHYLFKVADKINIYPLAGLSYHNVTVSILEHSASQGKLGFNLGGGAEYALTEKVSLGAEVRYQQISDFNQVVLGLGATFKL